MEIRSNQNLKLDRVLHVCEYTSVKGPDLSLPSYDADVLI